VSTTRRCEIVVVGAGVAGTAAAAELAQHHQVVLVEREAQPAMHASGRSASVLSESSGHPVVCALARLSRPFFEHPPEGFSEHPLLAPRGLLWIGEAGDEETLDALYAAAASTATTLRRLDADATAELLPSFQRSALAGGGVHEPDAMVIDTAELIQGNLRRLRRSDGELHLTSEAIEVTRGDDGWIVAAGEHRWSTRHVVNAAGAWVDVVAERAGVAPLGMRALRRTAALVPAPDEVAQWPLVMDVAGRYYCEPETGGLLISPADETHVDPCDAQPDELDVALAIERVAAASGLPIRSIRRAWAGLRTFAPDRVPVLGEESDAPGFWWLAGQGGAGIKTAPAMATLLATLIGGHAFPDEAAVFGVTPESLSPTRLRSLRP
jgi:D-arginine dehydrogenase